MEEEVTPAETPATDPIENNTDNQTPDTTAAETETPAENPNNSETEPASEDNTSEALVYPSADADADTVLKFRKACGYPDTAEGYGLPMETDEEKNLANFLHKCQLDGIAAKTVAQNLTAQIEAEEQAETEQYKADLSKVKESWGEKLKANESLVKRGSDLLKINDTQLRGISDAIGVEAALNMMMLVGKTNADYSGVSGGSSSNDDESLDGFISRKRGR